MKRALLAFALGLAGLTLTACDDGYGYYGGVYSASYPHYRYYDDYYYSPYHYGAYRYGPVYRGYWDNRRFHHPRGVHDRFHRGGRHWRDGDARSHRFDRKHHQGTDMRRSWRGRDGGDHRNWRRNRD